MEKDFYDGEFKVNSLFRLFEFVFPKRRGADNSKISEEEKIALVSFEVDRLRYDLEVFRAGNLRLIKEMEKLRQLPLPMEGIKIVCSCGAVVDFWVDKNKKVVSVPCKKCLDRNFEKGVTFARMNNHPKA